MDPFVTFCPNPAHADKGRPGHYSHRSCRGHRYRWTTCGRLFTTTPGYCMRQGDSGSQWRYSKGLIRRIDTGLQAAWQI